MSDDSDQRAVEAAAKQAQSDRLAQHTRGFVIVKWMDRYSYYLTPIPQATLEEIVSAQTRAEIVARYAFVDDKWVRLPL